MDSAIGDFNGDSIIDIATANRWGNNLSVLYGKANGTFGNRIDIGVGVRPESLKSGDFNHDGLTDIVVSNWSDGDVTILLQTGGDLVASGRYPVGNNPNTVIAEDLDRDGRVDIATANSNNTISVLTNGSIGGFTRHDYAIDSVGYGLLAEDFNRDGILDLATTLPNTGSMINILRGNPGGGYETRKAFTFAANRPAQATSADFNHDGALDIAYAGYSHGGSMVVLLGDGNGDLKLAHEYGEPSFTQDAVSADFNFDGNVDVAVSDGGKIFLYYGLGDGGFKVTQLSSIGNTINSLSSGDLNGDGVMDIVATAGDRGYGFAYVYYNLHVVPEPASWGLLLIAGGIISIRRSHFRAISSDS